MSDFLQLITVIAIILVAAKAAGYLSTKLKQPSVFGELLVGVLLGPSLLNLTNLSFISDRHLGESIHSLGEIGVLLLMFLAGIELHISELTKNTRVALLAGTLVVALGITIVVSGRFWPQSSRKYQTARLAEVDGSPIGDWDALSDGRDPT